jgi:2-haloacid dehalogenase
MPNEFMKLQGASEGADLPDEGNLRMGRRDFMMATGAAALIAGTMGSVGKAFAADPGFSGIKACVFDTFGTLLNWRASVSRQVAEFAGTKGVQGDWEEFTDRWRGYYLIWTEAIGLGKKQYIPIDYIHRIGLDELSKEFGLQLSEEEKVKMLGFWRRLDPWPDVVEGLGRLKQKYIITPLSNSDFGMMTEMSKFAGMPWDAVLAAEMAHTYKPNPTTYLLGPKMLGFEPRQVLMCAGHVLDLDAARKAGLRTAFIARPNEFGEVDGGKNKHYTADLNKGDHEFGATSVIDLARQLGA